MVITAIAAVLVLSSPNMQPKTNLSEQESVAKYAPTNPIKKGTTVDSITPNTSTKNIEADMQKLYDQQKAEMPVGK